MSNKEISPEQKISDYQRKPSSEAIERANKRIAQLDKEIAIQKEIEHIHHILKYGCPPSPYQMRNDKVPTQRELDDTEREYQRIKKEKEQREAEIEAERLRREHILRKMKGLE